MMEFDLNGIIPQPPLSRGQVVTPLIKGVGGILALGAESAGNFCVYYNGIIHHSEDSGDLLGEGNFLAFKKELLLFLKSKNIKPTVVLCDLHPDYRTSELAVELSERYKAELQRVQHHAAHIFSAVGDRLIAGRGQGGLCDEIAAVPAGRLLLGQEKVKELQVTSYELSDFYGIAMDGTGYGEDGKIWGGEAFEFLILNDEPACQTAGRFRIIRIGHLENQVLIGGDLAVKEPARVLLAVLAKLVTHDSNLKSYKNIYKFIEKYYSRNEFELLNSQLQQGFNCVETSSAGRVLDAVAVLLGFADNERKYKHEATMLLEENSTTPYLDIMPKIIKVKKGLASNAQSLMVNEYILDTTYLFEYLVKNLDKDKRRLAATAQKYIAEGLGEIIEKKLRVSSFETKEVFVAGGMANNKIISDIFENKGYYLSKNIPRGDAGLSFGQVICFLMKAVK